METATIEIQKQVRPDAANAEAHEKALIELALSFEDLYSPQMQMQLGRLLDGRLRIVEAFTITLSAVEGQSVAEAQEVGEIGVGRTQSEALRDLQATLGELYLTLEADSARLGVELLRTWEVLQRKIQKRA